MAARAEDWIHELFAFGVPITYRAKFSIHEYDLICEGIVPQSMEDKWFIYFEAPHLFFHRSWTGKAVYRVSFSESATDVEVTEALCVADVVDKWGANEQARLIGWIIGNLMLGRSDPFPAPSDVGEDVAAVFQHHIAGTGFPSTPRAPRSWLRFWGDR